MKRMELINEIKDALQKEDELNENMVLKEIEEWDSLAALSIIALFNRLFSVTIKYSDINKLRTIKNIIELVENKLEQ